MAIDTKFATDAVEVWKLLYPFRNLYFDYVTDLFGDDPLGILEETDEVSDIEMESSSEDNCLMDVSDSNVESSGDDDTD